MAVTRAFGHTAYFVADARAKIKTGRTEIEVITSQAEDEIEIVKAHTKAKAEIAIVEFYIDVAKAQAIVDFFEAENQ